MDMKKVVCITLESDLVSRLDEQRRRVNRSVYVGDILAEHFKEMNIR